MSKRSSPAEPAQECSAFKAKVDQLADQLAEHAPPATLARLFDAFKVGTDQLAGAEAAARHWYRLFRGDSQPPWPIDPYPGSLRRCLEQGETNDPHHVEEEIEN